MEVRETPQNTTLIIPENKWGLVMALGFTVFCLAMSTSFIFEAESFAWNLRDIQWESESGEKLGPIGNVFSSLMFIGMASLFSILGIWWLLHLDRACRIVIDKDRLGQVSVIKSRWLRTDKQYLVPRANINSIEIVTGDSETEDSPCLITDLDERNERVEVNSVRYGGKNHGDNSDLYWKGVY